MNRRPPSTGAPRSTGEAAHNATPPAIGLPIDQAATLLPPDLIQGDETVILLLKPSPLYIVLAPLGTLVGIAALAAVGVWLQHRFNLPYSPRDIIAIAGSLILLRLFWQTLQWISRTYVLTDRRVIRVKGFFRVMVFQTELRYLQHTGLIFSIRERIFGLGTISFSTAGTGVPEAFWVMIAQPLKAHRTIIQAINRYR